MRGRRERRAVDETLKFLMNDSSGPQMELLPCGCLGVSKITGRMRDEFGWMRGPDYPRYL